MRSVHKECKRLSWSSSQPVIPSQTPSWADQLAGQWLFTHQGSLQGCIRDFCVRNSRDCLSTQDRSNGDPVSPAVVTTESGQPFGINLNVIFWVHHHSSGGVKWHPKESLEGVQTNQISPNSSFGSIATHLVVLNGFPRNHWKVLKPTRSAQSHLMECLFVIRQDKLSLTR